MSFPRYPKYKDSGVEWLGQVPEHWALSKIKDFVTFQGGGTPTRDNLAFWNGTIPWVSPKDMKSDVILSAEECITEAGLRGSSTKLIEPGEVLIVVRSGILQHTVPVAINDVAVALNQDMKALRPDVERCLPRFLFHWIKGLNDILLSVWLKQGATVESVEHAYLANTLFPLPAIAEQNRIVQFLDQETGKIDALVAEQERLMELLKEKRQAVISHAVTKGLNPNAPMKPSGIDWIGDIPAHWDSGSLIRIAKRIIVGIAEAATHAYSESGVPILRSTNIRAGRIIGDILFVDPAFANDRGSKQIYGGDLVTVRTGNAGVTAVIPPALSGCQCFTMLVTTLDSSSLAEFYCFWMNSVSAQCYFGLEGWGTAQINISVPILKALPVPIPTLEEQKAIVRFLDHATAQFDQLIAEAERAIDLLLERRSALISAAVTGQIDVRKFVASEAA